MKLSRLSLETEAAETGFPPEVLPLRKTRCAFSTDFLQTVN